MHRAIVRLVSPRPADIWHQAKGARIRRKRREKGLSQQKVASLMGVTQPLVSAWEKGSARLSDEDLWRLSEILETTVGQLVGQEERAVHKPGKSRPHGLTRGG